MAYLTELQAEVVWELITTFFDPISQPNRYSIFHKQAFFERFAGRLSERLGSRYYFYGPNDIVGCLALNYQGQLLTSWEQTRTRITSLFENETVRFDNAMREVSAMFAQENYDRNNLNQENQ